ncbi:alcohol dehydrogenase catalytic domain-containing protein [Kribbella sandramycini]|uniref:Alcohol dehydrogenase catalytic domain-containing protein n=1 Tax=Kribbella sandramycini TaxID=60450 RepID=A0A7Y4L3R0_9ACTN|nr:alcohol dehydrogenase catalytic domain-containing protein [Kribbella sandramycini]MBB6570618.1 propanol-preferring alcohol dehydrogenase [Kribbella sandramycini]NOL43762.1 alcohol dehydrogenase catalytic domain-containing protein [Kribbella sandramycini]
MTTYHAIEALDGAFAAVSRELTEPGAGRVRIRVEACGVCHSDVLGVHNLNGTRPAGTPIVPGHEVVGWIDAVGAGVGERSVGQRVGVGFLAGHCGVCANCRRGDFVYCSNQPVTGDTIDGGYAEYLTVPASGLVAVPEEWDAAEAAPLLCAGITVFNGLRKGTPEPGAMVAVQGIGGLGHLAIQYAAKLGLRVAAIARGEDKRQLALELGATDYIDSSAVHPGQALQQLGGAQVIIATAASGASMSPLVEGLGLRGKLIVVGAAADPIEVTTSALIFGGRSIEGSLTGTPSENEANLAFALANNVRPLVERVPLDQAPAAYARMMSGAARFRMVLTTGATR